VQIYDFCVSHPPDTQNAIAYMVMDYVEGQTFERYLRNTARQGMFPSYTTLLQLFAPICLAVDYAHQKGMIHRDIKPSNILLDKRNTTQNPIGEPILTDFGIARLLGVTSTLHTGWHLGTPSYTSPEQVMGSPGSERSDIYALSIVLYEACTGVLPFRGDNPGAVMVQHVHSMPISPLLINPRMPPELAATILQGLAKKPVERFPTASALCVALANAVKVPLPENIKAAAYQVADRDDCTYIRPSSISSPSLPSTPNVSSGEHPQPCTTPAIDPALTPSLSPTVNPALIPNSTSASYHGTSSQPALIQSPQKITSPGVAQHLNRIVLARLLVAFALVMACLGTLLFFTSSRNTQPAAATGPTSIGYAFFVSSGQLNQDNSQGINDELLFNLHNMPNPPVGKAYYAWLLGDETSSEPPVTPLGRLNPDHGSVHFLCPGNQSHTNLLAVESRLLITEEDASLSPTNYTPDTRAWAYYAEISQAPSPADKLHFSLLAHLRHLLSGGLPELDSLGLHGGVDMWFLRNTQKILEWPNAARDDWQTSPELLHRQIVRILDYLDGASYVQQDVSTADPILLSDVLGSQIALLGPPPSGPLYPLSGQVTPGYVYLLASHLDGALLSPDASQAQRNQAAQIHVAIDQVKNWFEQIHQDARQLVTMNVLQLGQPQALSLLDDMVIQAQHAYDGQTDPATGQQQGGAIWICGNIQRLATFDIRPYKVS
jgi:serine/threonine protein kinase